MDLSSTETAEKTALNLKATRFADKPLHPCRCNADSTPHSFNIKHHKTKMSQIELTSNVPSSKEKNLCSSVGCCIHVFCKHVPISTQHTEHTQSILRLHHSALCPWLFKTYLITALHFQLHTSATRSSNIWHTLIANVATFSPCFANFQLAVLAWVGMPLARVLIHFTP